MQPRETAESKQPQSPGRSTLRVPAGTSQQELATPQLMTLSTMSWVLLSRRNFPDDILCLSAHCTDRPVNPRDEVLRQGIGLHSENRIKNHLVSLDAGFFYGSEMGEGEETKETRRLVLQISPRMASLRQEDVLISSFLPSSVGQGSEQKHLSLTGRGAGFSEAGP